MDKVFKCQRCERVFKRKWDMKRHLSRKNPCMAKTENIPENGIKHSKIFQNIPKYSKNEVKTPSKPAKKINNRFVCEYCERTYGQKYNLNKHQKKCQIKKKVELEKKEKDKLELRTIIEQQKNRIKLLEHNGNTQTINNTNCNNTTHNNTINITLNNYGDEDISYITEIKPKETLKYLLLQGMSGLHDYINYKYCNPEQPQNFTIKYSNDRSKYVSIRDQNVWKRKDKDAVMNELYDRDNNVEELLQVYEKINEIEDDDELDEAQSVFLKEIDKFYDGDNTISRELDKYKSSTLTNLYNCHKVNKDKYCV